MNRPLILHPGSRCDAVTSIGVNATRSLEGELVLEYAITGTIRDVRIGRDEPGRGDRLWEHTCFEAFVRGRAGKQYLEFNISPSRQWAVHRFDGYRTGMAPVRLDPARIDAPGGGGGFDLSVCFPMKGIHDLPADAIWQIGLSAVVEETNGRISYWALCHPPGKPDFHHPDCFALELPPPSAP